MKTKSAKAKGRSACKDLQQLLLGVLPTLTTDDIRVTSSGANGPDLQLSTAAKARLPFSFEVKKQERLNIWDAILQCKKNSTTWEPGVLVFTRNHHSMYAAMELETFLKFVASNKT
jgi:hypothetical protein